MSQTTYEVAPATVPTPANPLDTLRERMMMQAQYTNLGGVESLWVNHTVRCCGPATPTGIQWSQINVTGGTVLTTPVQQQLYPSASDTVNRWMGSLAVDQNGDMALGYSAANSTTNPDIRYAGRLAGDPLGTLPQTENTLLNGVTLRQPGRQLRRQHVHPLGRLQRDVARPGRVHVLVHAGVLRHDGV